MAAADQTTDPDGGVGADAEALIRSLGVSVGDRLDGRYRLERVLHTTGPAVTWLAADEKLNRPSRIHLLRSDQPRAEAFMAAARAAAAMADNHFVQVLDAVPDDGLYYVITEWLHDGHTLGEVLSGGPVPIHEAVRITTELARAMTEAHDQGLAHLRLSPKTVLRTDTGEVKILDLCLAAALTGTVSRDPLGTDLTAIGELAYALLTGKRPQPQPLPPSELRPEVTPQLDEVVLRILGDETAGPAFQTPTEVADALAQLPRPRYEAPLPSTPQTAPLRHQQTTVMPAAPALRQAQTAALPTMPPAAPSYQTAPQRPVAHGGQGGHGAHGGTRRPAYDDDRPPRGSRSSGGSGGRSSSMMIIIGVVAVVAAISLLAYSMFSGSKGKGGPNAGGATGSSTHVSTSESASASAAPGAGLPVSKAMAYTSKPGDNADATVGNAYDGNPSTAWNSASYQDAKIFRHGSGVIFDLGSVQTVKSVDVTLTAPGATVQMFAAAESVTDFPAVKDGSKGDSTPDGFTQTGSQDAAPATFTLTPSSPMKTRFVLVWFTQVPQWGDTHCGGKGTCFGDGIAEVKFNGGS
ncbi:protein kinase [Catenulispora subtropica]|uniref:Protein kinase domain-containing protein n=1 Tax=Catenulispora subtropica TaxID=450798 RepID=A0ABP5C9S1_9ACTN